MTKDIEKIQQSNNIEVLKLNYINIIKKAKKRDIDKITTEYSIRLNELKHNTILYRNTNKRATN